MYFFGMITKNNFSQVLQKLGFQESGNVFTKKFENLHCELAVDFEKEKIIYPENKGFTVNERQTCNFKAPENFVVFECVHRLLSQGYKPEHIELEPRWQVGHGPSGGNADILIKDNQGKTPLIIECKTAGAKFTKAWNETQTKPTQIFSYAQQTRSTKFVALYTSDFVDSKIENTYYLISLQDNEKLLENDKKLLGYKDATTTEGIYKVWTETYQRDFAKQGLFEDNEAYKIGKTKFQISDLKNVNSKDIQGKYHEFATILRQHNVSGRENAFDKLVNLFLCKVTDEKDHPTELQFYWKGIAYDNPFDFQDRLQKLYKNGMEKFIGEKITYIDDNSVDEAFSVFKNKPNATKEKIKQFLKEQKFFTNNDFAFIDVHNERLFYQNFSVLLKISRMIQDISLTESDENQFLGDMFEGFLDQGIKQSEGQYFTPMPIVKFIIHSLPKKENPKVIDYACGSGHFLNEYASKNPQSSIVGIEKEYRLSKVAKVSSFMYGNEINIIYEDALRKNEKVKENDFDVLIANPPYSVKGFLETLSEEEREKFELTHSIDKKSYSKNNAIECFFIERAKQLLKKDAVAGIILPSSILSKGGIYTATREILLKYFCVVAIAEFGSGTFGKTGTNTVTLFLKRRGQMPNIADHLQNMIDAWFECDLETNTHFTDENILQKYCQHREIDFEVYKTLLCEKWSEKLFAYEAFSDYKNAFEKLTETKNRRKKGAYKNLSKEEREAEDKKALISYIRKIEKDKMLYFALAYKNEREVVIVKSPSGKNEIKKFLGYEWSSAKGNEGIKYLASHAEKVEDEELEEEDKRVLENLTGLKHINTPLYNPHNTDDESRINTIIRQNFENPEAVSIPEQLRDTVNTAKLVDMLDFERVECDKSLSLSPKRKVQIESKWDSERIEKIISLEYGKNLPEDKRIEGNYPVIGSNGVVGYHNSFFVESPCIVIGRKGSAGKINYIQENCTPIDTTFYVKEITEKTVYKYIYLILELLGLETLAGGTGVPGLNRDDVYSQKIPLPPLEIQEKIVAECEKVDAEGKKAQETIEEAKKEIEKEMSAVSGEMVRLGDVAEDLQYGANEKATEGNPQKDIRYIRITDINDSGELNGDFKTAEKIEEKYILQEGDFLFARSGNTVGKTFLYETKYGKCLYAGYLIKFNLKKNKILPQYLRQFTKTKTYWNWVKSNQTGSSQPNINGQIYSSLQIPLPPLSAQKEIVAKIEKLEQKIHSAQEIVDASHTKKEAVIKKWL